MTARDDYPLVFNLTKNISTADQANAALDEIDRLREIADAATEYLRSFNDLTFEALVEAVAMHEVA